jgi:TolB-like protein/Tfp pilus assembly protein PilF
VAVLPVDFWSEQDQKAIREQLDRILKSGPFLPSERRQRFLKYLVDETLAGRGTRLKAYAVALAVFDRPESFDPGLDPLVRIEAGRLRDKLREYYDGDGRDDCVRIELPKGGYTLKIEIRPAATRDRAPHLPETPMKGDYSDAARRPATSVNEPSGGKLGETQAVSPVTLASPTTEPNRPPFSLPVTNPTHLSMAAAALLMLIVAAFWTMKGPSVGPNAHEKPSIAVLPFNNIGDDPQWARLADGMTEDVILDLTHSKDLVVIARSSTEIYRGKPTDVRLIGRELGVKYVLESSLQPLGERIRVTAQLIDAASGTHVWSQRYDRPSSDMFVVQNEVTQSIAATLGGYEGAVAEAERQLIRRKPPSNLTAFDTYLLAMESKHKVTKEGFFEAERLFRKALELDPQLARAYVGLVDVQCYMIDLGLSSSVDDAISMMTDAAEMAVKLDPNDGKSHLALGFSYSYRGKPEQAASAYARAEALAPSDADVLALIAWYLPSLGGSDRAVMLAERSLKLNPRYPHWYNQGLSLAFFFGQQYDKSIKYRLLVKEPLALDYAFLAMANAYLGRTGDAATAAANVKKLDPTWNAERYLSEAGGYAEREAELFINGARKSGLPACVSTDKLKEMPNLIRVKSCERQRQKVSG